MARASGIEWRATVAEAWRVLRAHPGPLVVPGALLFLVFGVPGAILDEVETDEGVRRLLLVSAAQLLSLATSFLYYGYCEEIVRHARERGRVSIGDAMIETGRVLPRLVLAGIVTSICIFLGLLLLVLPGLWLLTRWALVSQVVAFEHAGLRRSIRRSVALTRGNMRLVATTVVPAIVFAEVGGALAGELGWAIVHDATVGRVVGAAVGQLLTGAVAGALLATVYFRLLGDRREAAVVGGVG